MVLPIFPIDKAYLVGGWLAATLWGSLTTLFILCMIIVYFHPKQPYLPTAAIIVMYLLATSHISLVLARLVQAFTAHLDNEDAGTYLTDTAQPMRMAKDVIFTSSVLLWDLILVWRCFVIWEKRWRIVALPAVMVLTTAVFGYVSITRSKLFDTQALQNWTGSTLALSTVTDLILTLLTAGRIWWLTQKLKFRVSGQAWNRYRAVILAVIEAGMLVTLGKIIELVLFLLAPADGSTGLHALYTISDSQPQLMAIAPMFIVMAIHQGYTSPNDGDQRASGETKATDVC